MTIKAHNNERWFIFHQNHLVLNPDNSILDESNINMLRSGIVREFQLTTINNDVIFCAEYSAELTIDHSVKSVPLKQALSLIDGHWYTVVAKALGILSWDKLHQYCGLCGHQTTVRTGYFERICQSCCQTFYPRISPSIIVLIQKGDEVLMARSPHFSPGTYGLIAGFVETGESIEETVHREVMEEVGIKIKNLRYFGSQAWPFPDSLMIGFYADYESGEITLNSDEIEAAGWYTLDNLPGRPSTRVSIASKLIDSLLCT